MMTEQELIVILGQALAHAVPYIAGQAEIPDMSENRAMDLTNPYDRMLSLTLIALERYEAFLLSKEAEVIEDWEINQTRPNEGEYSSGLN